MKDKENEGELGAIGLFLVLVGCLIITVSILAFLGLFEFFSDPSLLKLMILIFGLSIGLTEVVAGWLFAKHPRK